MISRKYANDYRLENKSSSNGKIKTVPVYIGKNYNFKLEQDKFKKSRLWITVLNIISLICIIGSFVFRSDMSRIMYISLPYAASLLPLGFQSAAVFNLFTLKTPYTREQKDKTCERLAISSFFCTFFSTVAVIGTIIVLALNRLNYVNMPNITFTALLILFLISECVVFTGRKRFEMVERM